LGLLFNDLNDYPRAVEYLDRALSISEGIGDKELIAIATGNLGLAHANIPDFPLSLKYYECALSLSEEIGARRPAGYWMLGIACVKSELGENAEAIDRLVRVVSYLRDELQTSEMLAEAVYELGKVLVRQGKNIEGVARLEEAKLLAIESGEKNVELKIYKVLAETYATTGEVVKALGQFQKHYVLNEQIYTGEAKKRIEAFNIKVAIANKERDAKLARQDAEIQQLRADNLQQQVAMQASAMAAQADLLDKFRSQVVQVFQEMGEPLTALKKIKEKLHELPQQEIDFQKIEADFAQAHPEFRTRLIQKFPELTDTEIRVCMLLKLGLKTIDAARLMSISERTIDGHRNNLRKKLGLKPSDNLGKFLQSV
jgi:tetratricopeptide (TPR) repeat protein